VDRKGQEDNNHHTSVQVSKYHCNYCNIDGHTEDKCWKIHLEPNPINRKKDTKKKILLGMDSNNQEESNLDVDEKIVCITMQKEVNMSSLHHK
jgi:hypothetical protein